MKKMTLIIKDVILVFALLGFVSSATYSQEQRGANAIALKTIADIVASINHFPSDSDKATLGEIAGNDELAQGVRAMATAVSGISHGATDEGKAAMASIQQNAQAPDRAKQLAGIIASINHTASDGEKATLAQLFP
tara:strand:- start:337 stop:744 length:408 start_codon:yes stop_codon:yes gene_type:complete